MVNKVFCLTVLFVLCLQVTQTEAKKVAKEIPLNQVNAIRPGIQGLIQAALKLDLSSEQKIKLKTILDGRDAKTKELQEKSISLMEEYLKFAVQPSSSRPALIKKNREVQSSYEALRAYQLETWLAIKSLLKEEQLQSLEDKQSASITSLSKTE